MAWGFVAVSGAVTAASGNITLTEPAGVIQGDLLVACISYRSNAAFTKPSGWTDITSQNTGNTTANGTGSIGSGFMAYIRRGSSAPSLVFTRTAGDVAIGRIVAYRDSDSSGTLVTQTSATLGTAATAISVSGVTTSNDRDLIVVAACGARNSTFTNFDTATDPATASSTNSGQTAAPIAGTWQERADSGTTTGADCSLGIADAVRATAGATGNITITASSSARHVVMVGVFKEGPPVALGSANGITLSAPTLSSAPSLTSFPGLSANPFVIGAARYSKPALGSIQVTPSGDYSITFRVKKMS